MKNSKVIKFNGEELTVKELSVEQVIEVTKSMNDYTPHVLDVLIDSDIPIQVVLLSTGLEEESLIKDIGPSALAPLYEAVTEVNPNLAAMAKRLRKIAEREAIHQ